MREELILCGFPLCQGGREWRGFGAVSMLYRVGRGHPLRWRVGVGYPFLSVGSLHECVPQVGVAWKRSLQSGPLVRGGDSFPEGSGKYPAKGQRIPWECRSIVTVLAAICPATCMDPVLQEGHRVPSAGGTGSLTLGGTVSLTLGVRSPVGWWSLRKVSEEVSSEAGPFCLRLRAGPVELALRFIWVGAGCSAGGALFSLGWGGWLKACLRRSVHSEPPWRGGVG